MRAGPERCENPRKTQQRDVTTPRHHDITTTRCIVLFRHVTCGGVVLCARVSVVVVSSRSSRSREIDDDDSRAVLVVWRPRTTTNIPPAWARWPRRLRAPPLLAAAAAAVLADATRPRSNHRAVALPRHGRRLRARPDRARRRLRGARARGGGGASLAVVDVAPCGDGGATRVVCLGGSNPARGPRECPERRSSLPPVVALARRSVPPSPVPISAWAKERRSSLPRVVALPRRSVPPSPARCCASRARSTRRRSRCTTARWALRRYLAMTCRIRIRCLVTHSEGITDGLCGGT